MAEYYLDLATMMGVLQSLGQTGQIEGDLPAASIRGKENLPAGHLTIGVKAGHIYAWTLVGANRQQILAGNERNINTLLRFYAQQRIKWTFVQQPLEQSTLSNAPAPYSPASPSYQSSGQSYPGSREGMSPSGPRGRAQIPYRKQNLTADTLATMPRQHRIVYALVNGVNTVERIYELLPHLSRDDIAQILKELYTSNIISF
ncbi:hypothetical protein [Dictyobacter formicarum]|uniref:Uncharacterized protein n=1 Tax=Dictyobacter formicarum TaxID=2778368 RepID=A0ABQ3VHC4_9CHLR|nr:hypothetical protein [Dictyobacter formicarum]GHO84768.1 hypothetical protein KSZ_27740 [Dictyobacter formicarum]